MCMHVCCPCMHTHLASLNCFWQGLVFTLAPVVAVRTSLCYTLVWRPITSCISRGATTITLSTGRLATTF